MSGTNPPPRQDLQAKGVAEIKKDMQSLVGWLDSWAGKSNKPDIADKNVQHFMLEIKSVIGPVAAGRHWPTSTLTLWNDLWETYNNGKGSWTKMLPIAEKLNAILKQTEA